MGVLTINNIMVADLCAPRLVIHIFPKPMLNLRNGNYILGLWDHKNLAKVTRLIIAFRDQLVLPNYLPGRYINDTQKLENRYIILNEIFHC